jgi:hypothetical protein
VYNLRSDKAAEYREQAETIRTMAQQVSLNDSRKKFLDAARKLDGLVEEEERKARQAASHPQPGPEV